MSLRKIDKHFQQCLLINKIMSNYQRKETSQESLVNPEGKKFCSGWEIFTLLSEKRVSGQVCLFSFYLVNVVCILQKKILWRGD